MTWWSDLSDDELSARLSHRGEVFDVPDLVASRDEPESAQIITMLLDDR